MVKASEVQKLRQATGAGMMDCKKALNENDGDFEKARDWLRTNGLSAAARKAGRVSAEGLVGISNEGKRAAIIELNSETDFVANNTEFQGLVSDIAQTTLSEGDLESLKETTNQNSGKTISEMITNAVATIGENISLRRVISLTLSSGVICSYVHNPVSTNMGKIGALVSLESSNESDQLKELGKQIAMHIAAAKPLALTTQDLSSDIVERERSIFREQSASSGKPANIIEKMVEGRMRKFYEEYVLLDQIFVIDGKTKINDLLVKATKDLGTPVTIKDFARFQVGEGIEAKENDFASEVAYLSK
jgi:elongation factor Ts